MGKKKKNRNKETPAVPANKVATTIPASPILPRRLIIILSLLLAFIAVILYAGSYGHDYAYDDLAVLKENRFVQKGLGGIKDILNTQYFEGYDPNTNARAYRPVSLIMYAVEFEFFGLDPQINHLVNILLYPLTSIVLLLALLRMLTNFHWSLAFVTTLLFVVHPVHVDVVANIKSRDELVGFFCFCVSLL